MQKAGEIEMEKNNQTEEEGGPQQSHKELARSFMDQLDDESKRKMRDLADYIREAHSGDSEDGFGTPVEFYLFARHKETGRPMVAHETYRGAPYMTYSKSLRGVVNSQARRGAISEILRAYAAENPGSVPAMAFPLLLEEDTRFRRRVPAYVMEPVLESCGRHLASALDVNLFGETQLVAFLRCNLFDARCLELFLDHVPDARVAMKEQHPRDGSTPVHLCVSMNLDDHLRQLLGREETDLTLKDHKGRTALDLARILGNKRIVELLEDASLQPSPEMNSSTSSLDLMQAQLGHFPGLYLPSNPDLMPSQVNEVMFEYLRNELPQLLGTDPSLIVLPPIVDECPYPDPEDSAKAEGWRAEMKTLNALVRASRQLRDENPRLHIAVFHDLRYGCRLESMKNWESDFDAVVMCFDLELGAQFVVMCEVKSITSASDVVRKTKKTGTEAKTKGTHALDQLCTHFSVLPHHVGITADPDWIIPCLVLPKFPTSNDKRKNAKEEGNLQESWNEFLQRTAASTDAEVKCYSKIKPQLLTRSMLENEESLKQWFESILSSATGKMNSLRRDQKEKRTQDYSTLLAWCVAHCMGVAVNSVSKAIDDKTEEVLERLALLTSEQKKVYQSLPKPDSKHLLIIGAAGTGKTLIGVKKLIRLELDGFINEQRRGLFLTHGQNVGVISFVREQLEAAKTKFVGVRPLEGGREFLLEMRQILCDPGLRFIVVDQLEDMYSLLLDGSRILPFIMDLSHLDMMWVTLNPFDVPHTQHENLVAYLSRPEISAASVILDKRIRNTTKISALVDRTDASVVSLPPHFRAEPVGLHATAGSAPVYVHYFNEKQSGQENFALAGVLHYFTQLASVKDKHILVVNTKGGLRSESVLQLKEVDKCQIGLFCLPRNWKVPCMAPLLVQAAWVGDIKNGLCTEQLKEVHSRLLPTFKTISDCKSVPDMVSHLNECLQNYTRSEGEWSGLSSELDKSVALQATVSLLCRFLNVAESNGGSGEILRELADTMTGKSAVKGRKSQASSCQQQSAITPGYAHLRELILRQRCVSALDGMSIGGHESDVVVVWDSFGRQHLETPFVADTIVPLRNQGLSRFLARAKVTAILVIRSNFKAEFELLLGRLEPLETHLTPAA